MTKKNKILEIFTQWWEKTNRGAPMADLEEAFLAGWKAGERHAKAISKVPPSIEREFPVDGLPGAPTFFA